VKTTDSKETSTKDSLFKLTSVKVTKTDVHKISLEVESPYRGTVYYMVTYASLFECEPKHITGEKDHAGLTPHHYGKMSTTTEMPKYGTGSNDLYVNIARLEINRLDSYTPFMIIVTAENQFG
jgi:hypothetical protein